MELACFFRSVVEQDRCPVVICDTEHTIVYMNPAAKARYARQGGGGLVGQSLLACHGPASGERIRQVAAWFQAGPDNNIVYTSHNEKENKDVYMVALRDKAGVLIGYYEKHDYRNPETDPAYQLP